MTEEFKQLDRFVIKDLETLKVLSDPLRLRIVEATVDKALTTKQIARAVGLSPSRLYYHISLLEQHGLLAVTGTRIVSGIVEKYYRCVSQFITVDKRLFGSPTAETSEAMDAALTSFFDAAKEDLLRSLRSGLFTLDESEEEESKKRPAHLIRTLAYVTPEQARALNERLKEINAELDALDDRDAPGAQPYTLLQGFFPILDPSEPLEEEIEDQDE